MTRLRVSMIAGLGALLIMHPQTAGAQNNGELSAGWRVLNVEEQTFTGGWYADVLGNVTDTFGVVGEVAGHYKSFDESRFVSGIQVDVSADARVHTFMGGARYTLRQQYVLVKQQQGTYCATAAPSISTASTLGSIARNAAIGFGRREELIARRDEPAPHARRGDPERDDLGGGTNRPAAAASLFDSARSAGSSAMPSSGISWRGNSGRASRSCWMQPVRDHDVADREAASSTPPASPVITSARGGTARAGSSPVVAAATLPIRLTTQTTSSPA